MRSSMSWEDLWPLLFQGTVDTVYMVGLAALFTVLLGLPTGVLLFVSRRNGLAPMPKLNAILGAIINFGRSLPFIVLPIAVTFRLSKLSFLASSSQLACRLAWPLIPSGGSSAPRSCQLSCEKSAFKE